MAEDAPNTDVKPAGVTLKWEEGPKEHEFSDLYTLGKKLQSGSYGTVFVTQHKQSGKEYAVKVIDKSNLSKLNKLKKESEHDNVRREVKVLKDLKGIQGIVSLIDFFDRPEKFHIVQDYAKGGDVFDRLAKRNTFSEENARDLARRLLETMRDMHKRGYVHRDLKPENLLLKDEENLNNDEEDYSNILVADFGFSKKIPDEGLKTRCGTPAFVAPEILVGGVFYRQEIDMWSVGVLLFLLIGGYPPYVGENNRDLFQKIRAADYIFHEKNWTHVSIGAKQLIAALMCVNPEHRWTAEQALECSWVQTEGDTLSMRSLSPALAELRKFNARRKLKSAIGAVRWATTASFWNADNVTFSNPQKTLKKTPLTFLDVYDMTRKLTKGSFATVWECKRKENQEIFAVKVINRQGLARSEDEAVMNETAIVQSLDHKHIVKMVDFFEETDYFFLVMDYMTGGDVFDRIVDKNQYTEKDARDLVRILLEAVEFMHEHGVAHRDLKPQNLLLRSKDDDADIKVADFGFSRRVHTPQSLTTRCGTPTYVAPEILKNIPHDTKVDMWSVGVIIFVLLVGYPPFLEDKQQDLFRKIRSGDFKFDEKDWNGISTEARDLIKALLVTDPAQRPTAAKALKFRWFAVNDLRLSSRSLTSSLRVIKKEKRKSLRSIATAVMWMSRCSNAEPVPKEAMVSVSEDDTDSINDTDSIGDNM